MKMSFRGRSEESGGKFFARIPRECFERRAFPRQLPSTQPFPKHRKIEIMTEKMPQLQLEIDTAYLYESLANIQEDVSTVEVLRSLAGIEKGHAEHILGKIRATQPDFQMPPPSRRARFQFKLGGIFGYDFIIANLSSVERQIARSAIEYKLQKGEKPSGMEHNHLKILESLSENTAANVSGGFLSKMEGRHKSVGGNALRAAVLGANDGLVSNMSLVMGIAGAAAANNTILLTGLAGLLAGAISMALGE